MKKFRDDYALIHNKGELATTYTIVYMPTRENLSHHESIAEAKAQLQRYIDSDVRRMKTRFVAGRSAG